MAQRLKRLPPMRETQVRSLGQEDSPGEGNGNPLQILACEIPLTENPGRLHSPWGRKRVRHNLVTKQQQQYISHSGSVCVSISEEVAI